jgi:hypothetical protein
MKRKLTVFLSGAVAALLLASSAQAAVSLSFTEAAHEPSLLAPGTINRGDEYVGYSVRLKNTGTEPTTGTTRVAIGLPAGMQLAGTTSAAWSCDTTLVCSSSAAVAAGSEFEQLKLEVWVFSQAPDTPLATFKASGGGTVGEVVATDGFSFGPAVPFGLHGLTAGACTAPPTEAETRSCQQAEEQGAASYELAGGHPFAATSSFTFNQHISPAGDARVVQSVRDLLTELPVGFVGNPQAVKGICTTADVRESTATANLCPNAAAVGGVGVALPDVPGETAPLYRVAPEEGYVAAFAFRPAALSKTTIVIRARLRSSGDYGISAVAPLPPESPELLAIRFATLCGYGAKISVAGGNHIPTFAGCKYPGAVGAGKVPFLTNQTRCAGGPPLTGVTIDSFQSPGAQNVEGLPVPADPNWKSEEVASPEITDCNALQFEPEFEGRPTTNVADSPSGLDFHLHLSQQGLVEREERAEAHLKDTTVVLPAGMSVNPSAASGLEACSSVQIGMTTAVGQLPAHFTGLPDNCPAASKLGTVEVQTPLLEKPLFGSLYLAKQFDNPFDSLLALYISIHDPETGIVVKLPGKVSPDPVTGQLTVSFEENPQVPFEDLELHTFEGPRASLRTPATCGPKATDATFTPWSAPESGPPAQRSDSFETTTAPGAGHCASTPAELPNSPRFSAGTISPQAGSYSPFVMKLSREDGSQELKGIDAVLPPGLTGKLAGVEECSDARLALARSRSGPGEGALEQQSPSCPAGSQVGAVNITAGAGPVPFRTAGKAYLAGPYKGAPISLAVIVPAIAGPFDLGAVVVRNPLFVDPETARITVRSDEIPHILDGIPLDVRSIEVRVDRDQFTLNPTSCEPSSLTATAVGLTSEAQLASHFQVGNCSALAFRPKLRISLKGSTKHAGHPALKAVLTYPKGAGYANIARAQVNLPHSEFIDQGNLNKTCTRPVLLAGNCPATSIYGKAKAWTPLLEKPLEGPVYLVGGYGYKLPALVAELNGQIRVVLKGKVDSGPNKGIRNTFEAVPDAPVEKFVLEMKGGPKYSLLENSENLCQKPQRAIARFTAQNGAVQQTKPLIATQCPQKVKVTEVKGHGKAKGKQQQQQKNLRQGGRGDRGRVALERLHLLRGLF